MTMDVKKTDKVSLPNEKPQRRRLRASDPDFVPPDGGWGWLIIFACGFSNLSTFPMFQQFGLVFREKFEALGISNAQTTTVINMNSAFNACVGLLNGPVFRKFSYRQVALFGGCLVAFSLFLSTFCQSFWTYLIFYSACYGSGIGITQSANALALNTYFKNKRRIATGLSWTTTGLGPIVWPYIITFLIDQYGVEGALLIFAAFAGHAILCSMLLQPVHWHTKFREVEEGKPMLSVTNEKGVESGYYDEKPRSKKISVVSSQYVFNEDDPDLTGYEILDPGTPMMILSNDGWYSQGRSLAGSRLSLYSNKTYKGTSRITSGQNSVAISTRPSYKNLADARSRGNSFLNLNQLPERKRKLSQTKPRIEEHIEEHVAEDCPLEKAPQDLKEEEKLLIMQSTIRPPGEYPNEKDVLKNAAAMLEQYQKQENRLTAPPSSQLIPRKDEVKEDEVKYTFCQKVAIFFDLDLLKDPIYLNLMLGITIANFAELNFSILTPFVLQEFSFEKYQIATFMSLLGAMDLLARFFIPFIADKIGWENRTFFLVGVLGMALGRIILVHTQTFGVSIFVAMLIGFGKGLRTIFMALVIPSYVPLERLPAASGLQLVTSGLLFLVLGPVVGWIRDLADNYVITLHILNFMTYITTVAWTFERIHSSRKSKKNDTETKL